MAHTYKHDWKYRAKKYWKNWSHEERIFYLNGNILLEKKKDRSFNPPPYFDDIWKFDNRKKWIKKALWHKHRRKWKVALHKLDYSRIERLERRPERYGWIIW